MSIGAHITHIDTPNRKDMCVIFHVAFSTHAGCRMIYSTAHSTESSNMAIYRPMRKPSSITNGWHSLTPSQLISYDQKRMAPKLSKPKPPAMQTRTLSFVVAGCLAASCPAITTLCCTIPASKHWPRALWCDTHTNSNDNTNNNNQVTSANFTQTNRYMQCV